MRSTNRPRLLSLVALGAALFAQTALAASSNRCPANHKPIPSAEERQQIAPEELLRCFLSADEIDLLLSTIDHNAQTTVNDPSFDSGELNPDGSMRPPLSAAQIDALIDMHTILDADMRGGAIIRKFIPNSDIGGFLYGRTVIGSPSAPIVVTTNTVRGFVGLERNTLRLNAGETVAALGLDFETTEVGRFTDASPIPFRRQVSAEIRTNGLHSIRHTMSAQGASDAKIPLAKDLRDAAVADTATFSTRSFEMNRSGSSNPYTGLGYSADIGLLTLKANDGDARYPLRLNEEDVMTVPTPLAVGDQLYRRETNGSSGHERLIARYLAVANPDGTVTNQWVLEGNLSPALEAYYDDQFEQARARVLAAGG